MGTPQPGNASEGDRPENPPAEKLESDQQEADPAPKADVNQDLFTIRPPKADDLGFIFQTFIEGMYHGNSWIPQHIAKENFWRLYRGVLEGLFSLPGMGCWILCLSDDPDTIIGYLVCSQGAAHWVYVKKSFRGYGLARRLFSHAGFKKDSPALVSHMADAARKHLPEKWEFKPYLLF